MNQRSKVIVGSTAAAALLVMVAVLIAAKDLLIVEWWIYRLQAGDVRQQTRAAQRLGELGAAEAVSVLLAMADDISLQHEVIVKWDEEDDLPLSFSGRLFDFKKGEDNYMAELWGQCVLSVYKIGQASPRLAESKLIEALGDGSAVVRSIACGAILQAETPSPRAMRALQPLLEDADPGVRQMAASALKKAEASAAAGGLGSAPSSF